MTWRTIETVNNFNSPLGCDASQDSSAKLVIVTMWSKLVEAIREIRKSVTMRKAAVCL